MYPSIFNTFPCSYSNRKFKKSPFSRIAAYIFVSPGNAPVAITQCVARMERQFNAYQTPRSTYVSIFNSFRVTQCLSQCVSPKIAIFTTFLQRDAMQAQSLLSCSVCLSRSWIASKRIKISSNFFHHRVPTPFEFFRTKRGGTIPTETPLTGASNARGMKKLTIFDQYLAVSQKRL